MDLEAAIRKHILLLDTNLLINEFKRAASVLGKIPRPQRFTSPIAVWEFVHLDEGRLIAHAERMERAVVGDCVCSQRRVVTKHLLLVGAVWSANHHRGRPQVLEVLTITAK